MKNKVGWNLTSVYDEWGEAVVILDGCCKSCPQEMTLILFHLMWLNLTSELTPVYPYPLQGHLCSYSCMKMHIIVQWFMVRVTFLNQKWICHKNCNIKNYSIFNFLTSSAKLYIKLWTHFCWTLNSNFFSNPFKHNKFKLLLNKHDWTQHTQKKSLILFTREIMATKDISWGEFIRDRNAVYNVGWCYM